MCVMKFLSLSLSLWLSVLEAGRNAGKKDALEYTHAHARKHTHTISEKHTHTHTYTYRHGGEMHHVE